MLGRFVSKFIFITGCFTLLAFIYIASFYSVRNKLILPFEREEFGNVHSLRPVYNRVFYPLRYFVANGSSFTRNIPKTYSGTLEQGLVPNSDEKNHRSTGIDVFEGNWTSIGFVGRSDIIEAFDAIEKGTFVKLTFGRALTNEHDRFINKLTDVEVIDLMPDPRIEKSQYTEIETEQIMATYKSLLNSKEDCAKAFVDSYREKVLLHCQQTGYAQNIGGGCFHIVGYSLHTAVFEKAVNTCMN